ncbi:hypothetical protein, partial [Yersinia pestis]|uniref:hypothetical protein n=1 Tax=Yersinia pestis TaxID=632 RepID=UPI0019D06800
MIIACNNGKCLSNLYGLVYQSWGLGGLFFILRIRRNFTSRRFNHTSAIYLHFCNVAPRHHWVVLFSLRGLFGCKVTGQAASKYY